MIRATYDTLGIGYSRFRRPDPRIAAGLTAALGGARSVVNVGAGTGSYEPRDRAVVAVEPSAEMVRQRGPASAPAVRGVAGDLPLRDASVDAALAILTLHHWPEWRRGVAEMRRVARGRVVLLTWDPGHPGFWLTREYFPEILETDRAKFPSLSELAEALGSTEVRVVPVPHDCTDGFLGAYWRRPERYLDPAARGAISAFAALGEVEGRLARLAADLRSRAWHRRNAELLARTELDLGYRIVAGGAGRGA